MAKFEPIQDPYEIGFFDGLNGLTPTPLEKNFERYMRGFTHGQIERAYNSIENLKPMSHGGLNES